MNISRLTLKNFRNYCQKTVELSSGLNIFFGNNAAGKTNLLESVYVAGVGKSLRTNQDKEMVRWGEPLAVIRLELEKRYSTHTIEVRIDDKGKKQVTIDGIPQVKIGELLGYLNIVFFSPQELRLIKDGPGERRRFMDISLCQQSKAYLKNLSAYNRALMQRNKLLKMNVSAAALNDMLDVFDTELARAGAVVIGARYRFAKNIAETVDEWQAKISGGLESLSLSYETQGEWQDLEQAELIDALSKKLQTDRQKDIDLSFTNTGPHRDDLKLTIGDIDIRKYGSQGQQRSAALSLKLAEVESFKRETSDSPVLLLDDVLSELDLKRQQNLIDATNGLQTILTCTHFDLQKPEQTREYEVGS